MPWLKKLGHQLKRSDYDYYDNDDDSLKRRQSIFMFFIYLLPPITAVISGIFNSKMSFVRERACNFGSSRVLGQFLELVVKQYLAFLLSFQLSQLPFLL